MRYYLELQIRHFFDIQALPGILIEPLSIYLTGYGNASSAIPHYHMNDSAGRSLMNIQLENKTLFLQYIKVYIILYNFSEGVEKIREFIRDNQLQELSRLKFQSDFYNLLNEEAV